MLDNIVEWFPEEELLKADGYDAGIIGIDESSMRLIYSVNRCIQLLVNDGMEEQEAAEYFNFNVKGSWVGEKTPIWCTDDL